MRIPQSDRAIRASGSKDIAIWAEVHGVHARRMAFQGITGSFAIPNVPQQHRVSGARCEGAAVDADGQSSYGFLLLQGRRDFALARQVPKHDAAAPIARDRNSTIPAEGYGGHRRWRL